ncbi:hypothetical protein SLA2020_294760 [Shorea laevis]
MNPFKAPGPDGFSLGFFQDFWETVKEDVVAPCLNFLNCGGGLPANMNFTHIVLIPKRVGPKSMTDLRPISLCNVVYRILAKVLANRFKQVLQHVISMEQSAFLPNRLITDNAMIAFEILHYMRNRKCRKKGWQVVKLDMSKAFDRVEWPYLEQIMSKLGFAEAWIRMIMACVTSVQYAVLLNGVSSDRVIPSRGLRQGDPLSPYLFVLCAEGFTAMIKEAERQKLLHGARICRQAPTISHLFFADDSFLFLRAIETEAKTLLSILKDYELASGQVVNMQKSSITFSSNVQQMSRSRILEILGMKELEQAGKYLGFPTHVGRARTAAFSNLKGSFWMRINEWREQPLSRAGREVLIKSILQSLPTYIMGLFCLPLTLCAELEKIMNKYWWGGGGDIHKIHWMEWKKLALPKKYGGLGFRALHEFNTAMLAKQGWRMLVNAESLAAKMLKARYFPRSDFLNSELKPTSSLIWRSIWTSKELLKQGCRRLIGDGRSTLIWGDPWLPSDTQCLVQSSRPEGSELMYVSDLIDENTCTWRRDLVMENFNPHEAQLIMSIPLSWMRRNDGWTWLFTRDGNYSVRSGYHQAI